MISIALINPSTSSMDVVRLACDLTFGKMKCQDCGTLILMTSVPSAGFLSPSLCIIFGSSKALCAFPCCGSYFTL